MAAPPQCWSHYRCNLCIGRPAGKAGGGIRWCPECMLSCRLAVLILFISFFCVCLLQSCAPGGRYLAVLRQEHGLGVTEGLPDIMLGIRVVAAGDRVAQRHHVQGVGGEGALHALHGEFREMCARER